MYDNLADFVLGGTVLMCGVIVGVVIGMALTALAERK